MTKTHNVWITPYLEKTDVEAKVLGDSVCINEDILARQDGVIIWHEQFPGHFKYPDEVRVVSRFGAGVDNIDFDFCGKHDIKVFNVPDYGVDEVSDTALAFILSRTRGVFEYSHNIFSIPKGTWEQNIISSIRRTSELTLGIVGMGRIGSSVAAKARHIGFKVIFYDPYIQPGWGKVIRASSCSSLKELYSESDVISFNCPLNNETRELIDFDQISNAAKRPLALVNTARGQLAPPLVSICKAIRDGKIYSYDTDVLPSEPPCSEELLLLQEPFMRTRFIVTPHTAFYSVEAFEEMRKKAAMNLLAGISGNDNEYRYRY